MPFTSRHQMKKCFALKAQGKNGSWDCDKWAHETPNLKSLPQHAPKKKLRGGCTECNMKYQGGGSYPGINEEFPWHPQDINYSYADYPLPISHDVMPQPSRDYYGEIMNRARMPIQQRQANTPSPGREGTSFNKIDPYFALRGLTTGASWLSGIVDRNRQDQYMQNQLSLLGQHQASPVEDHQPNPYSQYAKYGGSIRSYMQYGGESQGGNQMAHMVQQCIQELQHGMHPQQILQQLIHSGIPKQQGAQIIQAAMQQLQHSPEEQNEPQGQPEEQESGMKQGGFKINPAHKGWCSPMTKSTCTGKRRAFALLMKRTHGFHKGK